MNKLNIVCIFGDIKEKVYFYMFKSIVIFIMNKLEFV